MGIVFILLPAQHFTTVNQDVFGMELHVKEVHTPLKVVDLDFFGTEEHAQESTQQDQLLLILM